MSKEVLKSIKRVISNLCNVLASNFVVKNRFTLVVENRLVFYLNSLCYVEGWRKQNKPSKILKSLL